MNESAVGPVILVFSKDRPLQLDGTLRSLELNCQDLTSADVHVLFKSSTPRFAAGYRVLASQHPKVSMHREADFKADLMRLVSGSDYVLFVVDDTIFVDELSLTAAMAALDGDPMCLGFSYRLGRNTTYCYTLDKPQRLPAFATLESGCLSFDWRAAEHDFGYPLEVSSSMYRTADVLPLVERLPYSNPNTLEAALSQEAARFRSSHPRLACYEQSVAVSVPANLVQTMWKNRTSSDPTLSSGALADLFSRGMRLDVNSYQGLIANACHQELDLVLKRKEDLPEVSVIIPCFNQAHYLAEAVQSVVEQTWTDWELVIVDDGSPDDTAAVALELIKQHPNRRIRVVRQPNGGVARARNAGVTASSGRYILPLDADDRIAPTMLQETVAHLESRPDVAVAYVQYRQFGEGVAVQRLHAFDPALLSAWDYVPYCSLFRRELWEAAGGYSADLVWGYEDWDFWLSAVESHYRMELVPQILFEYRVRAGSRDNEARAHDQELKALLAKRHPRLFTRRRRAATRLAVARLHPADELRQFLKRTLGVRRGLRWLWHRLAPRPHG